ncbi:MAG: DNA alkylation repair protein [Ruminococcaceae bacterium]|nr:DNA alkylation repair protein [Oscillospiraceae bacterium]
MKNEIQNELFYLQDLKYRDFHSALMPTVAKNKVIGVRMPRLRTLAKQIGIDHAFLSRLPHTYYEENNLHALMIMQIKDYETSLAAVNAFLPYIDNWATCDLLSPMVFGSHKEKLLCEINHWLSSSHPYTVRFGIGMLMRHYLDDNFSPVYAEKVAAIQSDEYYINMMIGWYFATALSKQYNAILPFLLENRIEKIPHNMAIRKAIESHCITNNQKTFLKTLKR